MKRNQSRTHRVFYAAYSSKGPWICYFCSKAITEQGLYPLALVIHHIDHQGWNDVKDNLTAAHRRCHTSHHASAPSREARYKMSDALRGRRLSPEHRAKLAKKAPCEGCGKMYNAAWMTRHKCTG